MGPRPSSSTNPVSFVLREVVLVLCLYIYLFQRLTLTLTQYQYQYVKSFTAQFYQAPEISLPHIILFVTSWLQNVLGVKKLRNKGILTKEIKEKSKSVALKLQEGHSESMIQFNARKGGRSKTLTTIIVVVALSSIATLQQHDAKSSSARTVCDDLVRAGIREQQNVILAESSSALTQKSFAPVPVAVDISSQCFVMPFKTSNSSLLLADRCSSDLSLRLAKLIRQDDASTYATFFENSLWDSIKKNVVIVHGMDLATLKPEQWLNDAVLQFWFKWISTPRCPDDNASSVHICSTYLLSGVLSEGYSDKMKKFLKKVNIFEKKIVMFPVHLASHWSLVAVLNPNLIKQTKTRFGDPTYSRDVTAMIHLDSLGSGTVHSRKQIAQAIRNVLNAEWRRYHDDALDRCEMPFSHRHKSFQLHCPVGKRTLFGVHIVIAPKLLCCMTVSISRSFVLY